MANTNLLADIRNIKGCKVAHIGYDVVEKLPKKVGIAGIVTKHCEGEVQVNYDYENAVNNRLERKGLPRTFKADNLPWGVWDSFNKLISHNGNYYLRFYIMKNTKMETTYYVDGRPITDAEYALMKAYKDSQSKGSAKQSAEGLDENQVDPRNVNVDGITSFKCGAIDYKAYKVAV